MPIDFHFHFTDNLAYKYIGWQKVAGPVTFTDLGWRNIPEQLGRITAIQKLKKNRLYIISFDQLYKFNDNNKTFENGDWPKDVIPNLLPNCHQ